MRRLRAVILDWAGTTVDYGSRAPLAAFIELFRRHHVNVTEAQARAPMGLHKKDHIREVARMEPVAAAWRTSHGREPGEEEIEALYGEFVPLQTSLLAAHADLIPGTLEAVAEFRRRGLKIGTTTGYSSAMMAVLAPEAAARGFVPDCIIAADQVSSGRPAPWMCLMAAMQLDVWPMSACVKIGDTPADIAEGRNAGMWTIGLTRTGNELGLSLAEETALSPAKRKALLEAAAERLEGAGAHYTAESLLDTVPLLDLVEARLAIAS